MDSLSGENLQKRHFQNKQALKQKASSDAFCLVHYMKIKIIINLCDGL